MLVTYVTWRSCIGELSKMENGSGSQLSGSQMNPFWTIPDGYAFSIGGAPNEYLQFM